MLHNDQGVGDNKLREVTAIVFDLDDTLFEKTTWILPAIEFAAARMGLDGYRASEIAACYVAANGCADASLINHVLVECGQSDSAMNVRAFTAWINQYQPPAGSLMLFPGAEDTLRRLSIFYKLAVIADGPPDSQRAKIAALALNRFITTTILSDEIDGIRSRRPNPRPYREALRQLGSRAGRTLFVGDNPMRDFKTAREIGMLTVRVLSGEYSRFDYPSAEHMADYAITSIARLPELLVNPQQATVTPLPVEANQSQPSDFTTAKSHPQA